MAASTRTMSLGYRHAVAAMGFMSMFLINLQRASMGVAIVAMVNRTTASKKNSTFEACPVSNATENYMIHKAEGEFNWSSEIQGYILGACFLGNTLAYLSTSRLSEIFAAKRLVLWGCFAATLATFISPVAARWNVYLIVLMQLIRGLGHGIIFVSIFVLMSNWFPSSERGLLSTLVISGYSLGAAAASFASGLICNIPLLGWPAVFYCVGGFGIIHYILFMMVIYDTPQNHPWISIEELKYLTESHERNVQKKKVKTPWNEILTSVPIYALIIGLLGQYWSLSYFWTVHSTFLGSIHNFPITENGLYSSLPYVMKACGEYLTSSFASWLLIKKYVGVNKLRKGCNTLGCLGFSGAVLGVYVSGCNGSISAICSAFSLFFIGVATPGAMITCLDMSPRFAGALSGLLNTIASASTFVVPVVVGNLTTNKTLEEWHLVFIVSIVVVMGSGVVFAAFGSAEVQPWNDVEEEPEIVVWIGDKGDEPTTEIRRKSEY